MFGVKCNIETRRRCALPTGANAVRILYQLGRGISNSGDYPGLYALDAGALVRGNFSNTNIAYILLNDEHDPSTT